MCGIAGFELAGGDDATAARLEHCLTRRGPDGAWFESLPPYGLVQTRLAVIDLSDRVRYPLRNESGDLRLLFNGEIYEYARERRMLERLGHRFATDCDAEVMLHGYEEWGTDVFARLDGMFVAALFDARRGELLLVRDALGIKPLAYTTSGRFAFASDALSLVAAGLDDGAVDELAIGVYVALHYLPPPETGLRRIRQLRPGELLRRSADGTVSTAPWRPRPFAFPAAQPRTVSLDAVRTALDRSVRRQLVADVPVGVFLSAGLDSSLVLDSAVRAGARPTAFTIGFAGHGDYDESATAARFARELGVRHVVDELWFGFSDAVARVGAAYDQPFADASALATLRLAELARGHVTVALSGTGGDDLFAGYYRHRAHLLTRALSRVPAPVRARVAAGARAYGDERHSALSLARSYLVRLAAASASDGFTQYLELVGSASSSHADSVIHAPSARDGIVARWPPPPEAGTVLRAIQAFELATYLPGDLLTKEDRASMAVGLEARVPLLGTELLELAEGAGDRQQVGLFGGKRLLRAIARERLPSYLARGRKRGFAVPLADMFAGPWRVEAIDWFADCESLLVDGRHAAELLRERVLPATDAWAAATLVGWEHALRAARREKAGE